MKIDLCEANPEQCSGCGACANICPKQAISMKRSWNGFVYPHINSDICVQCGLCTEVCDFKTFHPTGIDPDCYAVRHKDMEELLTSRSGGFFMILCEHVIQKKGIVFGCTIDEALYIHHTYRDTYEGCKAFKGSKYVLSDLRNTFRECGAFLREEKTVLFSGTGCQIHGLLSYLQKRNISLDNLITVDLVCHGAPSPGVWENFVQVLEETEKNHIHSVDFRDKGNHSWSDHVEKYIFKNEKQLFVRNWTNVFYRNILFRESCYNCKYATTQRKSDFTIADYWGIRKNVPEFDDGKGCSLVLVHTEKGKRIFDQLENRAYTVKTELSKSLQPQLCHPVWKGWDRKLFWRFYKWNRKLAIETWFFPSLICKWIFEAEKFAKRKIKKLLRK